MVAYPAQNSDIVRSSYFLPLLTKCKLSKLCGHFCGYLTSEVNFLLFPDRRFLLSLLSFFFASCFLPFFFFSGSELDDTSVTESSESLSLELPESDDEDDEYFLLT